jgi:hypothetical protein
MLSYDCPRTVQLTIQGVVWEVSHEHDTAIMHDMNKVGSDVIDTTANSKPRGSRIPSFSVFTHHLHVSNLDPRTLCR